MALNIAKPNKYARCICCGSTQCLTEYQFGDACIKSCVVLCSNCVTNMYKESQKETDEGARGKDIAVARAIDSYIKRHGNTMPHYLFDHATSLRDYIWLDGGN